MITDRPDFYVFGETQRDKGRKPILTRIGAGWYHEKGGGIGITIEALPLSMLRGEGKLVLFPPKTGALEAGHLDGGD